MPLVWDNEGMAASDALLHVIVVGGSLDAWTTWPASEWVQRLDQLGKVADQVGARWVTVRPYCAGGAAAATTRALARSAVVGGCTVKVDPEPDGRERLAAVIAELAAADIRVDESAISCRMNAPAEVDPDLVVVLGSPTDMPTSLVWELAYSELVFVDTSWADFGAAEFEDAIDSYATRHRRFGGVD
jgi:undecaprenyl diphosphate synthase